MRVVPDNIVGRIEFGEDHVDPWTTNAVAMGSTAPVITAWEAKVVAARAAYQAQKAAQNAAKATTNTLKLAMEAMDRATSEVIAQVRTKAMSAGDSVYSLAEIPAPATPSPVGSPGTPYQLEATLLPNGTLDLGWQCDNPAGCNRVIYQIYRKVESSGAYAYVGGAGTRKFVDTTVPSGVPSIMYQIMGTRSTAVGVAAEFVVNFGVGGGSPIVTSAASRGAEAKIAA